MKIDIHSPDESGNILTLTEDLTVTASDRTLTIPSGFSCDGASVPAFLYRLISPPVDSRTAVAAVFHDYCYRGHAPQFSRKEADQGFYELCVAGGLSPFRARLAYWGVRLAGSKYWQGSKK